MERFFVFVPGLNLGQIMDFLSPAHFLLTCPRHFSPSWVGEGEGDGKAGKRAGGRSECQDGAGRGDGAPGPFWLPTVRTARPRSSVSWMRCMLGRDGWGCTCSEGRRPESEGVRGQRRKIKAWQDSEGASALSCCGPLHTLASPPGPSLSLFCVKK